jgi:hypothetical protein
VLGKCERENTFYGERAGQVWRVSCREEEEVGMRKQRTTWKLKAESRESGNESAHVLVFTACMCNLIGARGWAGRHVALS